MVTDGSGARSIYIAANESSNIVSPSYPDNYPDNSDVAWAISTEENRKILVVFSSFDTEDDNDLFSAGNGAVVGVNTFFEWSGTTKPYNLLSIGNNMWLRFTSDGSVTSAGFSLSVTSVPSTGMHVGHVILYRVSLIKGNPSFRVHYSIIKNFF